MTWWVHGRDQGIPLWWRVVWPVAWLWEQLIGETSWYITSNEEICMNWKVEEKVKQSVTP